MKRLIQLCLAAAVLTAPVCAFAQSEQEILARFAHEPTIEDTQAAAVDYAGLGADRVEGMYGRAGGANALPKVLSYEMTYRDQDRIEPQSVYTYHGADEAWTSLKKTEKEQNTDYIQHKIKAQWDLSRVVFNPDQIRVVSAMANAAKSRDVILKLVTKTYFARRKAQIDLMLNPPSSIAEKLDKELRLQEMTAQLDALTGGWFSKNCQK